MSRKLETVILSVLVCCLSFANAAQRQRLKIVPDPSAVGVRAQGDTVRVEWVQLGAAGPESEPLIGDVYYASSPAAGDLSKYTKLSSAVSGNALAPFGAQGAQKRVTRFVPARQGGRMGAGAYYAIVASVNGGDTLYSDYFSLMVASADPPAIQSPMADIMKGELVKKVTDLAPLFTWKSVPGVPYYHIVLSDRPFIDESGKLNAGVNIIWQAITPNTRIAYGAPDPSNTITAPPPPLSPGTTYSWMVLNNYGNHPAFTSWDVVSVMNGMAGRFMIDGKSLVAPKVAAPARGSVFNDAARIEFKWTNLDVNANSYLVNLFREGSTDEFGMGGMGSFSMSLLAWETTVPRGDRRVSDTLSVTLDAGGTLTGGSYMWRVYAIDSRGAASTDTALSSSIFIYNKADEDTISIKTFETIGGVDLSVGYVELKSEVISGPTMAPLLFYTDGAGILERRFSAGTYRITATKDGYFTYTSTVTVRGGSGTDVPIPMLRSDAVLYGKVLAAKDSSAVNAAKITAVSEWGDSLSVTADGGGSFMLACRAADWYVTVEKPGFRTSARRKVTLMVDDNYSMGSVYLTENPFGLSGVVRNSTGSPLMGAQVRVLREGVVLNEIASTPQNGAYAFFLDAGTYTLTAEKPGFAMFSRSVVVTGTLSQDIALREGAVLVSGNIVGKSWVAGINNGAGDYVSAPITSARLVFAEVGAVRPDTFTVTSDAVFGKFSVSLPPDKDYNVTSSADGFASHGAAVPFTTVGVGGGLSKAYADTLYALATIKGSVTGAGDGLQVDVIVYGADGRIVASGRSVGGVYEVRNIPDGEVTVGAGADGYFARDNYRITIENGKLTPNQSSYDFAMEKGDKSVRFRVDGYAGSGVVKVVSPLNRALSFDNAKGMVAELNGVGAGKYAVEAVSNDTNRLELSYHAFEVPEDGPVDYTETLYFPFTHTAGDSVALTGGNVKINWPTNAGNLYSPINRVAFFYRSEGSVRFDSVSSGVINALNEFSVTPVRDGCNLYYYFRVYLENGDIYGSGKQLFHSYVKPDDHIISRVTVEPGVAGGDTLVMPSSYPAAFVFRAFYSDQFVPISGNVGSVSWSVLDAVTGEPVVSAGMGMNYTYITFSGERNLVLRVRFEPSSGYVMKAGVSGALELPVKITGKPLNSIEVLRKGDAGPVSNTERAGFRVQAFDDDGKPVTVSPQWGIVSPRGAGAVAADGLFTPSANFVGTAGITVTAGGLTREYTEPGAGVRGQRVYYVFKQNATPGGDTANTMKGLRVVFGAGALGSGMSTNLEVAVPELTNHVQKGTDDFRMADSIAFDLTYSDVRAISGDIKLMFDIPEPLRREAAKGGYEFGVARWLPDSLRWVPIDSARTTVSGGVVTAVLSPEAVEQSAAVRSKKKVAAAQQPSWAAALAVNARYALVTKTSKTAVSLSISPHPFSPYIVPKKEYGTEAKAGTCIKVNVQAPEAYVGSVKVRIYNATGKMVWGVEKLNAETGEHRFWWNGRTSGRSGGRVSVNEEIWTEDYYERNADKPLCRNGRYYVMVILTDRSNKQRRSMMPLVLMK